MYNHIFIYLYIRLDDVYIHYILDVVYIHTYMYDASMHIHCIYVPDICENDCPQATKAIGNELVGQSGSSTGYEDQLGHFDLNS